MVRTDPFSQLEEDARKCSDMRGAKPQPEERELIPEVDALQGRRGLVMLPKLTRAASRRLFLLLGGDRLLVRRVSPSRLSAFARFGPWGLADILFLV